MAEQRKVLRLAAVLALIATGACTGDSAVEPGSAIGPDYKLEAVNGTDQQTGFLSGRVNAPAVFVKDRYDRRVGSGVLITFSLTAGDGRLEKTQAATDADGYASAGNWILGESLDRNTVAASATGARAVVFMADAVEPGEITWYDRTETDGGTSWVESIALSENGYFGWETSSVSGWWWRAGQYAVSGTALALTYATGGSRTGTISEDSLSFRSCPFDCVTLVYNKRNGS